MYLQIHIHHIHTRTYCTAIYASYNRSFIIKSLTGLFIQPNIHPIEQIRLPALFILHLKVAPAPLPSLSQHTSSHRAPLATPKPVPQCISLTLPRLDPNPPSSNLRSQISLNASTPVPCKTPDPALLPPSDVPIYPPDLDCGLPIYPSIINDLASLTLRWNVVPLMFGGEKGKW